MEKVLPASNNTTGEANMAARTTWIDKGEINVWSFVVRETRFIIPIKGGTYFGRAFLNVKQFILWFLTIDCNNLFKNLESWS